MDTEDTEVLRELKAGFLYFGLLLLFVLAFFGARIFDRAGLTKKSDPVKSL
jgi:hypothetical protein